MTGDVQTDLPNGWQRCGLTDFAVIVMGQSPSSRTYNHDKKGLPFFQGKAGFGDLYPTINTHCSQPGKIAKPGATLLSVRAPVGPTNLTQHECCIGRGLAAFHPSGGIKPKFLLYLFRSIEPILSGKGEGSTFKAITKKFIVDLKFNLPPPGEQHRIVAKIEELFSELDKGIESLKTAREQIKVYRQAVLKHAFEGKLTAQWREENEDQLENPEQLLARIKQERSARYDQRLQEWKALVKDWGESGRKGKKPPKPGKLPEVAGIPDDLVATLPKLPGSWAWGKLGWLTCGMEYGTSAKSAKSGTAPVLRMGNIQNAKFDWTDLAYTSDEDEIAKYLLHDGDVLFNRTNSPELVGKTAIYNSERPAIFAGYLIRVNHIRRVADSQYVSLLLNSHVARQYGNSVKTDGVNQSNINATKLSNYPFPYCSIDEQHEMVRILEKALSLVDTTEAEINRELQKAAALRQSILKKAFSGQLVAQDPNDEPASVLLERIKAEKVAQSHSAKLRNKRRRAKATA